EGGGWLWIAVLLGLGVPFFKVFLAAQFLGGLALALLLCRTRKGLVCVLLPCAVATLGLVLSAAGKPVLVRLDPLGLVQNTLDNLNLPAAFGFRLLGWGLVWVGAGLGLRLLGLGPALRALVSGRGHAAALAAAALSGIPLGLLVRITLREQPGYDEAGYFVLQGGALLWIFAASGAAELLSGRRWVLPLLACLTLPSTVEFVSRKMQPEEESVPRPVLRAMAALETASAPGDVVLERPHLPFPPPPVVFAGRRVPFTTYIRYLPQFAPASTLASRHATLNAFFGTTDRSEAQALARSLGARFVCLYPDDRLRFDPEGLLEVVFTDGGTTLYRISTPP
ncbi:MAG TPA: hypothetical protein VN083_08490, partial [Vicinamibacteria bacterium]|nr:hypothetical protein [Vicinamibacteria bacterium]